MTEPSHMSALKYRLGSNMKGGSRPTKQIPWQAIFKQHISVIEGHIKMMDMVKKHTAPNTDSWRTICYMVERAQEMLQMTQDATENFVLPTDEKELTPLGSSSPAGQQYSQAAQENGHAWNTARAQGPVDSQDEPAQAEGVKNSTPTVAEATHKGVTDSASGPEHEEPILSASLNDATTNGHKAMPDDNQEDGNPYFVIDTNPTPVNIPVIPNRSIKRSMELQSPDETAAKKSKKSKTHHGSDSIGLATEKHVEFEDISGEVDARLKEKEEKRKRKEERKRKRQSETSIIDTEPVEEAVEVEKPKRKKTKKLAEGLENKIDSDENIMKKRPVSNDEEQADKGKKKKKRQRKNKIKSLEAVE